MNTWFTGDNHFFHRRIIEYCDRPFEDEIVMSEHMLDEYNRLVKPGDTVWHLGDVTFYKNTHWSKLLQSLHGHKHLILGNHDRRNKLRPYFETMQDEKLLLLGGTRLYLAHEPNLGRVASFQLHGHRHLKPSKILDKMKGTLDVGVDGHGFRPWHLDEVLALIQQIMKEIETEDRYLHLAAGNYPRA